jgi:hypothetical protein
MLQANEPLQLLAARALLVEAGAVLERVLLDGGECRNFIPAGGWCLRGGGGG